MAKLIDFTLEKEKRMNRENLIVTSDEQMMNNIEIVRKIFSILRNASIKKYDDIIKLNLIENKLLAAQKYPWVGEIAELVEALYNAASKNIREIDGQIFLVDRVEASSFNNVMKYSCVFPNRTIMSSGDIHINHNYNYKSTREYSFIDIEFFYKLFYCKKMLLQGIISISPFQYFIDLKDGIPDGGFMENLSFADSTKKKIAELDKCGSDYNGNNLVNKIFVAMPWLENARIDDYVEVVDKYRTEFECYNYYLSNISSVTEDTEGFIKKYLYDYKEASINLNIAMEKKQAELKTKGITTLLSLCLTAIPYLLPEGCIDTKTVSAFLGTGTIKEALSSANIFTEMKNIGKDNPFWVLWKWKNI